MLVRASFSVMFLFFLLAVTAVPAALDEPSDDDAVNETDPVSFYHDIRPIFQANCYGCHQPAKTDGQYVMTSFEQLLAGGESREKSVVPSQPDASNLLTQITPVDGEAEMPKKAEALSTTQIDLIARWIREGASDDTPENSAVRFDSDHPPTYLAAPVITSVEFSPDGSLIAVSGYHEVLLYNTPAAGETEAVLVARLIGMSQRIESAVFSPDGKQLAVTGGSPGRLGEVQVWDVESRELILSRPVSYDTLYGASWSPDGKLIAFGCSDNSIRAINVENNEQVFFCAAHGDWVLGTVFSVDGSHLVSISRDQSMKLYVTSEQRFVDNITSITPGALRGGLLSVERHPTEDQLLVGGSDGEPRLYQMHRTRDRKIGDDYNLIRAYQALPGRVFDVAISADGSQIAAGSSLNGQGYVNIYSTEEGGAPVATYQGELGAIYSVDFNADGSIVACGGFDGMVRLFDAATGEQVIQFSAVPPGAMVDQQ